MRGIVIASLLVVACGSTPTASLADLGQMDLGLPACPPGAEASHGARCKPGVDTACACGTYCHVAYCLCNGFWETDQIYVSCDGGADLAATDASSSVDH